MKTKFLRKRSSLSLALAATLIAATHSAYAADYVWSGGGSNNSWGDSGNWVSGNPGTGPGSTSDTYTFTGSTRLTSETIGNGTDGRYLNRLIFDANADSNFVINTTAANNGAARQLYFRNSNPAIIVESGSDGNHTIGHSSKGNVRLGNNLTINHQGNGTLTIQRPINSDDGFGITKTGKGHLILSDINDYNGGTNLNQGTISLSSAGTLGATTGALQVNNTNSAAAGTDVLLSLATGSNITVGSLSGTIATPTSGTNTATIQTKTGRTFTVNQTANGTYGGTISGSGHFTLGSSSTQTLTLTGANSYSGLTTITQGTLQIGNGGTTGSISGTSGVTNNANLTYNRSDAHTVAYAIGGSGNVTKLGGQTLTLTADNSYTGTTNISQGTLAVSGTGDINQSSGVTIGSGTTLRYNSSVAYAGGPITNNGGTIAGTGSIGVSVALDSTADTLAPGNSSGIQEYTVGQSWASFTYEWEVNDFDGTTTGTDFDQIKITGGGLAFTGVSAGSYILDLISLAGLANTPGNVADFSETTTSWNILTATGGISGFNADYWIIDDTGFTSSTPWTGAWSLSATTNNLVLTYTAIPEPHTGLLGGLGLLVLFYRRR